MKRQFLSLLMALCLMLTLAPAVFAAETSQPDTITLPNGEVREIPNVNLDPIMPASIIDLPVEDGYYVIEDYNDLKQILGNSREWYADRKFRIKGDIDMSELYENNVEWVGYIQYFYGTMEGVRGKYDGNDNPERFPKFYNIPNNCSLIYAVIGGTIENLIFEHKIDMNTSEKGSASFITFMPSTLSGVGYHLTMRNVTTTGAISLTNSDQSNYAPFVYCAPSGGLTMDGCINEATITGNIYGSVFHGYYPLGTGANCKYEFTKCKNNGEVTMLYAGMFFGNSSSVEGKVGANNLYLTITGCENNAKIRGTSGASYFAAPVSEFGTNMKKVEKFLKSGSTDPQPTNMTLEPIKEKDGASIFTGNDLTNFAVAVAGNDIVVTRPSNEGAVHHYEVSVNAYVNLWYADMNKFHGTDRVAVSQIINKTELTENTFKPDLKVYGFADTGVGELVDFAGDYEVYQYNNACYYWISNAELDSGFARYVSNEIGENGQPAGGGTTGADFVTVVAYNSDGDILDLASVAISGKVF